MPNITIDKLEAFVNALIESRARAACQATRQIAEFARHTEAELADQGSSGDQHSGSAPSGTQQDGHTRPPSSVFQNGSAEAPSANGHAA